jgi:hypothetical protein
MLSHPLNVTPTRRLRCNATSFSAIEVVSVYLSFQCRHVPLWIKAAGEVCLVHNALLKHMTAYDAASTGIRAEGKQRDPLNRGTPIMSGSGANPPGGNYLEYITSVAGSWASYMRLPLLASSVSIQKYSEETQAQS